MQVYVLLCVLMFIYMSCCNTTAEESTSQEEEKEGVEENKVDGVDECGVYKDIELDEEASVGKVQESHDNVRRRTITSYDNAY